MKKLSTAYSILLIFAFSSSNAFAKRLYAGANFGNAQGSSASFTPGAVAGANQETLLSPAFIFQYGFQVIQRSYQNSGQTFSYFYPEIPVLLKLNWGFGLMPRPVAGASIGFNVYKYCHNASSQECSAPQNTPMEYGAEFGLDEDFTSSMKFPFLQFRYHLPLSTVSPGVKLTGMSIALGFPLN